MTDDRLEKALARIAALESQLSARKPVEEDVARQLTADPVGFMTKRGVPVDHISRILVAHALGDAAPPELRMLAQMGPQVSAVQALASDLQAVRQRQEEIEERDRKSGLRTSFNQLTADKAKYPFLAAVVGKNPSAISAELEAHRGDAAALAEALEGRYKAIAEAAGYSPPASDGNADNAQGQSTQTKQAQSTGAGGLDPTPPPLNQPKPGAFTQEEHEALKQRIIRKYS